MGRGAPAQPESTVLDRSPCVAPRERCTMTDDVKLIKLPGGHWAPHRPLAGMEVGRAMNVLEAALAADLTTVTFEGVTYRWQTDPVPPSVQDKTTVDKMDPEIESRFASHPVDEKQAHDIERM